jgi:hypothetical protein
VQTPNLRSSSYDLQPRILFSQLTAASAALSDALENDQDRWENVEEARRHLEAFELLERGPSAFNVPHQIRAKVHASLEALGEGRLELAHASLSRAGLAFQKHLTQGDRARRWTH